MVSRRFVFLTSIVATAISCFTLGVMHTRRSDTASRASYDAKLAATVRAEVQPKEIALVGIFGKAIVREISDLICFEIQNRDGLTRAGFLGAVAVV